MNEKGQGEATFLFGIGILVLLGWWILTSLIPTAVTAGENVESSVKKIYSDTPLTTHAENSHVNQEWNATQIKKLFSSNGCTPRIYTCPQDDYDVHYCEINDNKSVGLIIGRTVEIIVTGFMADTDYWQNRCSATP